MGNSKNKKVPKKRKASNTSQRKRSSDQKENVPKNEKNRTIKPDPNDGIAMSKQLLMKKTNGRTQRRSSSKSVRICPNGKPLPSLSELEKMYEDSDEDDQSPKIPTQNPTCTTPTPEQQTPTSMNKLLSPSTINKISERLLGSIEEHNLPDPSELLEATSLLHRESLPAASIIPPKKRKKPEVPYIVGCKDRPKVIRKPNTNFCKGDDNYGVETSGVPEEETPRKRAKKSRIPKFTKSIFNAHSDEIAERLAREDAGSLSDASSDSNKTIEYDPTPFQNSRPHSFSPLPSTSTDTETFKKNDDLFNESLREINIPKESTSKNTDDLLINDESVPEIKEDDISITKQSTPIKKDNVLIPKETTPDKKCGVIKEYSTSKVKEDVLSKEESTLDDEVEIIEVPYDTIQIEDNYNRTEMMRNISRKAMDSDIIEIIEPVRLEAVQPPGNNKIIHKVPDDEDCMIVTSPETINNLNNLKNLNEPIVIDDEYSTINLEFDSFHDSTTTEVIDVDDIIAENKSILDKWNNNGAKELNKINTVVEVSTNRNTTQSIWNTLHTADTPRTAVQTTSTPTMPDSAVQTTSTPTMPSTAVQITSTPTMSSTAMHSNPTPTLLSTAVQTTSTPTLPSTAVQTTSTATMPNTTLQSGLSNSVLGLSTTNTNNYQNMRNRNSATNSNELVIIFDDLFNALKSTPTSSSAVASSRLSSFFDSILNKHQTHTIRLPKRTVNSDIPVSTHADNRQRDLVGLGNLSSHSVTQQTSLTNPSTSPVATRNIGDCPICLDTLNSSDGIASTICGHVFCLSCIQASVKTNGKKCPTCRKTLKGSGGGYHQLYL